MVNAALRAGIDGDDSWHQVARLSRWDGILALVMKNLCSLAKGMNITDVFLSIDVYRYDWAEYVAWVIEDDVFLFGEWCASALRWD